MSQRKKDKHGYWTIDGQYEHRLACQKAYGPIPAGWQVHHCDEDKNNNHPDNLIAVPQRFHEEIHDRNRLEGRCWTREQLLPEQAPHLDFYRRARDELKDLRRRVAVIENQMKVRFEGQTWGKPKIRGNKANKAAKKKRKHASKAYYMKTRERGLRIADPAQDNPANDVVTILRKKNAS